MAPREAPVYKEWSAWAGWITIVFWGTMVLVLVAMVRSGDGAPNERMVGALIVAAVAIVIHSMVAGLTVRLFRDQLELSLGRVPVIRKRVRYDDILDLQSVTYRPLMEFGGWGVRFRGKKRAWTARGNEAVVLHLADETRLYVGSDHPHRLEERIRTVAGTRIGPS
jgi:hypothetical protein